MKRRSFIGTLAAFLAAPLGFLKPAKADVITYHDEPINFIPPIQRLYVDWLMVATGPKTSPALFYPMAQLKCRLDKGDWGILRGGLPMLIAPGFYLKMTDGRTEFVMDDTDGVPREICFFDPDRPGIYPISIDWIGLGN